MKKAASVVVTLIIVFALATTAIVSSHAQSLDKDNSSESYQEYYTNRREFQLTEEQLAASTSQLIEYVLEYPFIVDLFVSSVSYTNAYEMTRESFNGFLELERRPDAASEMLKMLVSLTESSVENSSLKDLYLYALLQVPLYFEQLTEQETSLYYEKAACVVERAN